MSSFSSHHQSQLQQAFMQSTLRNVFPNILRLATVAGHNTWLFPKWLFNLRNLRTKSTGHFWPFSSHAYILLPDLTFDNLILLNLTQHRLWNNFALWDEAGLSSPNSRPGHTFRISNWGKKWRKIENNFTTIEDLQARKG